MLPPGDPLISSKNNQGVSILSCLTKRFQQSTHRLVNRQDTLVVLPDPASKAVAKQRHILHRSQLPGRIQLGKTSLAANPGISLANIFRLAAAPGKNIFRHRHPGARVSLSMAFSRCIGSMHRSVTEPEVPGLPPGPVFPPDVLIGPVRVPVGCITSDLRRRLAVDLNQLVFVIAARVGWMAWAIPDNLVVPVPPEARIYTGMPFSDLGCVIALAPKNARPEGTLLRVVGTTWIFSLHAHRPHPVLVMASKHGRSRRHAPGPHIGVGKANPLPGKAVDVGRLHPLVGLRVTADRSMRLVVGKDKQDVGPVGCKNPSGQQHQHNNSKQVHG